MFIHGNLAWDDEYQYNVDYTMQLELKVNGMPGKRGCEPNVLVLKSRLIIRGSDFEATMPAQERHSNRIRREK